MDPQILQNINQRLEAFLNTPGEPGDVRSNLAHISETALRLFEADTCFCFPFHHATEHLMEPSFTLINSQQENDASPLAPDAHLRTLAHYVLRRGPVVVEDVDRAPDENHRTVMRAHHIRSFAAIALRTRHRKRPLAVLYLNYRQKKTFNRRERQNLRLFALLAATLLQEAWLSWRYREISRIGQEINHELSDVNTLFEHLRNHIGNIANASDTFQLAVYHSSGDTWDIYRVINGNTSISLNTTPDEISRYVTQSGQSLFVKHLNRGIHQLPFHLANPAPPSGAKHTGYKQAIVAVPLQLRDLTLGTLLLQHHQSDTYNKEDLFALQLLANHIALALHNIRLHSNLLQLDRTGQIITQQLDSDEMPQATVDHVRIATNADVVILFLFDPDRGGFQLPPSISGQLHDPDSLLQMSPNRPDDIAELMLSRKEPLFEKQSSELATDLKINPGTRSGNFEQREEIASTAALPLRVNNETVGVLFVNFRQPQRFDSPQKLLIEGLGHYIAIAMKNAQTFEQLRLRHTSELDIFQHVDRELNRMLELQPILNKILELAKKQIDTTLATIMLYDARKQGFTVGAGIGRHVEQQHTYTIPLGAKSMMRWVMDHKQSARSNNVHTEPPWNEIYYSARPDTNTVSELDVPLLAGDDFVGIINFEHSKEAAFTAYDQAFLETLAGQTVLAVKKAQAYENEKRLAEEAKLLNEISREITSHLDFEHVFGLILEKALQLTQSTQGQFVLYDREIDQLRIVDIRGRDENRKRGQILSLDKGIVGYVARTQKTLNIDPTEEPWQHIFVKWLPDTRSELAIPMLAGTELRGVLNLESSEPNHFDTHNVQLLQALADLAVVALQNAERYDNAERAVWRFESLYQAGQELGNISDVGMGQAQDLSQQTPTQSQQEEAYAIVHKIIENRYPDRQILIQRHEENSIQAEIPESSKNVASRTLSIPITFKNCYYGLIEICDYDASRFREPDLLFIKGLAHQLATTLYRIDANQERQEFETRAIVAEAMSRIGQSAFELTHRLGNSLGLIPTYVDDIHNELEQQNIHSSTITTKLIKIRDAVQTVLTLSKQLKRNLSDMKNQDQLVEDAASIPADVLLLNALGAIPEIPETIECRLDIDPDTPAVKVVANLGADILRNLITNAIDAMPNGGCLTLRAYADGRMVALEVGDTGVGIAESARKKIFDLFFSTKQSSGFGLWSAKRYALGNYGDLTVESRPGSGSTFTLTLPHA